MSPSSSNLADIENAWGIHPRSSLEKHSNPSSFRVVDDRDPRSRSRTLLYDASVYTNGGRPTFGAIGDRRTSHSRLPSAPASSQGTMSDSDNVVDQAKMESLVRTLRMSPDLDESYARLDTNLPSTTTANHVYALSRPPDFPSAIEPASFLPGSRRSREASPKNTQAGGIRVSDPVVASLSNSSSTSGSTPILDRSPESFLADLSLGTPRDENDYFSGAYGFSNPQNASSYPEEPVLTSRRPSLVAPFDLHAGSLGLTTSSANSSPDPTSKSNDMTPVREHAHETPRESKASLDPRVLQLQAQIEQLQIEQVRLHQLQQNHLQARFRAQQLSASSMPPLGLDPATIAMPIPSIPVVHRLQQDIVNQNRALQPAAPFPQDRFVSPFASTLSSPAALSSRLPFPSTHVPSQVAMPGPVAGPAVRRPSYASPLSQVATFDSAPAQVAAVDGNPSEPLNFMNLLQPTSEPPYRHLVHRIIRQADQQASIFIQQKLKSCSTNSPQDVQERARILDAILGSSVEMMTNRFGNWAFQRCLEEPCTADERKRVAGAMRGRVVELAMNCYGTHVVQKALECEEDIRLLVLSELLLGDPAVTLINKHASHVWSRIMELTWSPPAPPIFVYVNKALRGRWVELATHETGSLVVQHLFENCVQEDTRDCLEEIFEGFNTVVRDQWGSFVIQHMLEHGLPEHRTRALGMLGVNLANYATDTQAMKSIDKALKVCPEEAVEAFVTRLCDPGKTGRRPLLVDLALNSNGSQLICQISPMANPDQRKRLAAAIKKHVVTLKGNKSGSKIVWMFDRMRSSYDGY